MTIFPGRLDPAYYNDDNDYNVLKMMEHSYMTASTINLSFWSEADTDYRFYAGDQTLWNDVYGNLPAFRRRQFNFNIIKPRCQMPIGYQRRNRKSTICVPIQNSSQRTADQFTKCIMGAYKQAGVLETISDAFEGGSIISGMNLMHIWMDYRTDPVNGDLRVDRLNYNEFLIDPFFRKSDLSDCNYIWIRRMLQPKQVAALLPDHADKIMGMHGRYNRDGKFQFLPESYQYSMENLLTYDEYWYRVYRETTVICDVTTGDTQEWEGTKEELERFQNALKAQGHPPVVVGTSMKPSTRCSIVVQGQVFYDGPNPLGIDDWPFVPVWGYYLPSIPYWPWRVQGLVRSMRDPQFLLNRRKIIELDIMESRANSGWIFEKSAPVDPEFPYKQTGQGRGIVLNDGKMDRIREIAPPPIDPAYAAESDWLAQMIGQVGGINDELMGMADDSDVAITTMLRQGAGLTTLQSLFDNLDVAQARLGKLSIEAMQANWTPGKVIRMIGEKPTEEFYHREFSKYDAVVQDGLNTNTQRQMYFKQLLDLRQLNIPVPTDQLLEALDIQNKDKLIEAIQKQEQQQAQMAQSQAQMDVQETQARMHAYQARAQADMGLGAERYSRVEENILSGQERVAKAEAERQDATLNLVRTLQEIQGMDLEHLQGQLGVAQTLRDLVTAESKIESEKPASQASTQPLGG